MRPGQMVLVVVVGLGARTSSSWALAWLGLGGLSFAVSS